METPAPGNAKQQFFLKETLRSEEKDGKKTWYAHFADSKAEACGGDTKESSIDEGAVLAKQEAGNCSNKKPVGVWMVA